MSLRRAVPAVVAALLACAKPAPSPEYARAQERWTALVQERAMEAALDPRADDILALLARVPAKSLDADAAAALRSRIEEDRRTAAEEEARRAKLVAQAGAATGSAAGSSAPTAGAGGGGGATASSAPSAPAATPPAAGGGEAVQAAAPGALPPLAPGLKLADFQNAYGPCFEDGGPVNATPAPAPAAQGSGTAAAKPAAPVAGRMWVMKDLIACREKHAALANQLVIFAGDAFAGLAPRASLKVERKQVELGKLPDGQVGMVVGGKVVPLPPGTTIEGAGGAKP